MAEDGIHTTRVLELLPNQTLLQRPCSQERTDALLSASDMTTGPAGIRSFRRRPRAAGISIVTDGIPGKLAAHGLVPHLAVSDAAQSDAFFTAFKLYRPEAEEIRRRGLRRDPGSSRPV